MRLIALAALGALLLASLVGAEQPDWLAPRSDSTAPVLPELDSLLPTPSVVLGYPLGRRFSRPDEILAYVSKLASVSDRVALWEYGRSYEDRPLTLMALSSPENVERLEDLRREHLAALEQGEQLSPDAPVFLWLAYGIHGNEASSAEAAMAAAFVLAAATGSLGQDLDDVVILLDPLVNPDGRARYVHSFETRAGRVPDSHPESAEHQEPWPGGRQNHYLVDLNRDWTWATQRETRARLREYRRWEPHVYVDFHEMSPRSTYFFPPSADPIHAVIDPATVRWLEVFGNANARAFDRNRWMYYVGENFDLFYPGYSDSYPSLRGSVGMTYEMAGHGRAGLSYERPDGTLLTLADRIARHLTTTVTTVTTAIQHRQELTRGLVESRRKASESPGQTYIWRADQAEARAAAELLEAHGIEVTQLAEARSIEVRPLSGGPLRRQPFDDGSYLLATAQPLSSLARSLMEPDPQMSETFLLEQRERLEQDRSTEFFDITAWSIPLSFNLETWVAGETVRGVDKLDPVPRSAPIEGDLGFFVRPQGLAGYRLVSAILNADLPARLALAGFSQQNRRYPSGTVFVPLGDSNENLEKILQAALEDGLEVDGARSALSESGPSLGSDDLAPLRKPRIGLVGGKGVRATSFGFLWFLMDQELRLPFSRLDIGLLDRTDLSRFDTLILPGGNGYAKSLGEEAAAEIERWVERGGILIGIGEAVSWLRRHELTTIEEWSPPEAERDGEGDTAYRRTPEQRSIYTPGAALSTIVQANHPLTSGIEGSPAALFRGRTILLPTGEPRQDLIRIAEEDPVVAGFAWPEAEERLRGSLLVGAERKQRGAVIVFSQDPFFRLFWRASAAPFLNAVLYAPSLADLGQLFQ